MLIILSLFAVVAILFAAGAIITHDGSILKDAPADGPDLRLPSGQLQPEDIPQLRFGMGLRGYRMEEVDEALDRVQRELTDRDVHIGQLQQALAELAEPPVLVEEVRPQLASPWPEVQEWPEPEQWPAEQLTSTRAHLSAEQPSDAPAALEVFPEINPPDTLPVPVAAEVPMHVSSFGLFGQVYDDLQSP